MSLVFARGSSDYGFTMVCVRRAEGGQHACVLMEVEYGHMAEGKRSALGWVNLTSSIP